MKTRTVLRFLPMALAALPVHPASAEVSLPGSYAKVTSECTKLEGDAQVCMVQFSDGTRCVVAREPREPGTSAAPSPAIACSFR
ncbi:MAG: hypothetical protein KDG50_08935 [Chromatiales bacterium]|nr:hypothetical protein [Chromatiales bacterium]